MHARPHLVQLEVALPQVLDVGEDGRGADDAAVQALHHRHRHLEVAQRAQIQRGQELRMAHM